MSKEITKLYERRGLKPPKKIPGRKHHTAAFHRIVAGIKAAGKANGVNPYAVATTKVRKAGKRLYK